MRHSRAGFSLIELLMVCSLTALIGLGLYQALSQGIGIWRYAQKQGPGEDVQIVFEKIAEDLSNAVAFQAQPFTGAEGHFTFFSRAPSQMLRANGIPWGEEIRRIRYRYDVTARTLWKEISDYPTLLRRRERITESQKILGNMENFKVRYYTVDRQKKPAWVLDWKKQCAPEAVKVTVKIAGEKEAEISRVIALRSQICGPRDFKTKGGAG
ncbi:MAG: PulJ/GspJ family protein [Candidatus Omnitrophota bacterium]